MLTSRGVEGKRPTPRQDAPSVNKSLHRALRILDAFSETTPEWSVSDLARHLSLSKSSVSTMLATLREFGLVRQSPVTSHYELGLRCLEMGFVSSSRLLLRDLAYPFLEGLRDDCGVIVYMAIPYQASVLYIEALYPLERRINVSSQGRRAPFYCTGIGKALLAYLPEAERRAYLAKAPFERQTSTTLISAESLEHELVGVRERGYAVDRQEREQGIHCVAAPVRDRAGHAVAAISISGGIEQLPEAHFPEAGQRLASVARDLTRKVISSGIHEEGVTM